MSVLTNSQKVVNQEFDKIINAEFALPISSTPSTTVVPATQSRGGALSRVILILMAFVVAGFAAVLASQTVGFTPDAAAAPTYTGTITIVPAKPASPIVRSAPAPKVVAKQTVRAGTTTTPQLGPVPKTAVVGRTGTATETRPQAGTQNQAAPAPAPKSAPQPEPATKPATQPKPVTDNGSGTTTPVAATPVVPPAPPADAPVATVPAPKPQPVAPTTNTTVVNSSPDGAGTTGNAVTDQGTGSQSAGSQMPQGTGPGAYNPGSNAGPSF